MKNNKRKNMYSVLCIIAVLIVFIIGGILAYLTDTDRKVNTFKIGNVDILLREDNWHPTVDTNEDEELDAVELGFGQTINKDPKIQNLGKNPAYVYMKVYVPNADYTDNMVEVTKGDLFEYTVNSEHWKELPDSRSTDGNNNIYVYYYDEALLAPTGETESCTEALFDTITLKDAASNLGAETLDVIVEAYAIQANGLSEETTVLNTEWAQNFQTAAVAKPYLKTTAEYISIADCTASVENTTINEGENEQITIAKINAVDGEIEPVTYSSSNTQVATVDSIGLMTAVSGGTATITVTGTKSGATKTIEITVPNLISVSKYGTYVDIGTHILDLDNVTLADGSHPSSDWRVFKSTDDGVWLILADYLPNNKLPTIASFNAVNDTVYCVNSTNQSTFENALLSDWSSLITGSTVSGKSGVIVKGAPTKEELESSWKDNEGYGIPSSDSSGYTNTLYFPHKEIYQSCYGYWLATPSAGYMWRVHYEGAVRNDWGGFNDFGVRSVVFLPSSIQFNTTNDVWTIAN